MPKVFFLESREITNEQLHEYLSNKSKFPPSTMENLEPQFIARCKMSTSHEGCIVFCMSNGMEPDVYEDRMITADVRPTYKGLQPKKVSWLGKVEKKYLVPGQIVLQNCGFQYCVNQQHLYDGGMTRNQHT